MDKYIRNYELPGFTKLKSITDTAYGTVEVLSNEQTGERVIMKLYIGCDSLGGTDFILQRVKSLQESNISQIRSVVEGESYLQSAVVYFDIENTNLYSMIREKSKEMSPKSFTFLFESLAKIGCVLEENVEHHPSITQQNVYYKKDHYFIIHPYIYDFHCSEAYKKKRVFAEINKPLEKQVSLSQTKRDRIKKMVESDQEARTIINKNRTRLQTNMYQIGIVVLASGLGLRDQDVKERLKSGKLDEMTKVLFDYSKSLLEHRIPETVVKILRNSILGVYQSFEQLLSELIAVSLEEEVNYQEESSVLGRPTDFESEK